MMKLINLPLTELIATYPDVAVVLQFYHIDEREHLYTNLAQLLKSKCFPHVEFLERVQQALMTSVCDQYKGIDAAKLTHDIVKRFHEPHRAQMEGLINEARYIEKKYAEHNSCPHGLHGLLVEFLDDLANHMEQEELLLFPVLAAAGNFNIFPQLAVAHHSHDRHFNMMAKLKLITHNFTPPDDAFVQWQALYENLVEFVLQLNMHIAIENQFLLDD